jgi:surfactin synthase thioesterase subunit
MSRYINVICLPYAGGNKYSYRSYAEAAPPSLKFITLEYPGRGSRVKEALSTDLEELIDDLYKQFLSISDTAPYVIYGHSMGGLLTYLLTKKILSNGGKAPLHLFITGTSGPSSPGRLEKKRSLMGKEEFIQEIKDFGGMPDEILQSEELLFFFEPILRADFAVSENYKHKPEPPFNIPVTVITGTDEDLKKEEIEAWQHESSLPIDFKVLSGGHFFIYQHVDRIIYIIAKTLSSVR